MIASVTPAGIASPLINKAKDISDERYEQEVKNQFLNREGLGGGLFFVSDIWKRQLQYKYSPKPKKGNKYFDDEVPVWGKGKLDIPWYEKQ